MATAKTRTSTKKAWIVKGTVWRVGNNVNTESITPSHWLHMGEAPMLAHIGEFLMPEFSKKMHKGDIWAGGSNLGCSSSRNAPLFLKKKGISVVICHSASRIFYRNALNSGLPIFEIGDAIEKIHMGDSVKVDIKTGRIDNLTTGETIQAKPLPDFIMGILEAGGINPYIVKHKSEFKLLK
ncbi:MAG: 3-isopropylmalate dehydratase [Syntrophorhabdales bacterium]|jgi:3-isopropylmalate/(R)-2-methylmalate dehydratase small subunit